MSSASKTTTNKHVATSCITKGARPIKPLANLCVKTLLKQCIEGGYADDMVTLLDSCEAGVVALHRIKPERRDVVVFHVQHPDNDVDDDADRLAYVPLSAVPWLKEMIELVEEWAKELYEDLTTHQKRFTTRWYQGSLGGPGIDWCGEDGMHEYLTDLLKGASARELGSLFAAMPVAMPEIPAALHDEPSGGLALGTWLDARINEVRMTYARLICRIAKGINELQQPRMRGRVVPSRRCVRPAEQRLFLCAL